MGEQPAREQLVKQIEHGDVRELRMSRPPVNALSGELFGETRTDRRIVQDILQRTGLVAMGKALRVAFRGFEDGRENE